jgi:hypothetical protein
MRHTIPSRNSLEQNVMVCSSPQMKDNEKRRFYNKESKGIRYYLISNQHNTADPLRPIDGPSVSGC